MRWGKMFAFTQTRRFFSTFARSAAVHGDWMFPGPLDKPPLSIYASALSMHFVAAHVTSQQIIDIDIIPGEFAARLPNVVASIMLLALTFRSAWQLSRDTRAAVITLFLVACSPYLLVFSASAFTDVWMMTLMMASLVAAISNRPGWSGLWLGLSLWAKQQGVFYFPLVVGILLIQNRNRRWLLRFMATLLACIFALLMWDSLRPDTSLFTLAAVNNNPELFFVRVNELLPRLEIWLGYLQWMLGSAWLTVPLMAAAIIGFRPNKSNPLMLLIMGYVLLYLLGHWLIAFNTYDRYMLPIVPLVIVLVGNGLSKTSANMPPTSLRQYALIALCMALIWTGLQASQGKIDLGRDGVPRQNTMIELSEYLNSKPLGSIIYDRWLGWELGYYMGAWTDKRRTYYPEPKVLAEDALLNPELAPRYFVSPVHIEIDEWLDALQQAGFEISLDYATNDYRVYVLSHPLIIWVAAFVGQSWQGRLVEVDDESGFPGYWDSYLHPQQVLLLSVQPPDNAWPSLTRTRPTTSSPPSSSPSYVNRGHALDRVIRP